MDELYEYCARMLGDREAAAPVAESARQAGGSDRMRRLTHAVEACRAGREDRAAPRGAGAGAGGGLAATVAAELSFASAQLPQRQQEALALRELLSLSHGQVAAAIGIEPAAVAALLARSRLRLRAELRGRDVDPGDCPERERTLRTATLRQDEEPVTPVEQDWLVEHLGHCAGCGRAHAAMLEGSVCYRGWRVPEGAASADAQQPGPRGPT